jgi:hypothetical protein
LERAFSRPFWDGSKFRLLFASEMSRLAGGARRHPPESASHEDQSREAAKAKFKRLFHTELKPGQLNTEEGK